MKTRIYAAPAVKGVNESSIASSPQHSTYTVYTAQRQTTVNISLKLLLQSQQAVTAHFWSKQLLFFYFERQCSFPLQEENRCLEFFYNYVT